MNLQDQSPELALVFDTRVDLSTDNGTFGEHVVAFGDTFSSIAMVVEPFGFCPLEVERRFGLVSFTGEVAERRSANRVNFSGLLVVVGDHIIVKFRLSFGVVYRRREVVVIFRIVDCFVGRRNFRLKLYIAAVVEFDVGIAFTRDMVDSRFVGIRAIDDGAVDVKCLGRVDDACVKLGLRSVSARATFQETCSDALFGSFDFIRCSNFERRCNIDVLAFCVGVGNEALLLGLSFRCRIGIALFAARNWLLLTVVCVLDRDGCIRHCILVVLHRFAIEMSGSIVGELSILGFSGLQARQALGFGRLVRGFCRCLRRFRLLRRAFAACHREWRVSCDVMMLVESGRDSS